MNFKGFDDWIPIFRGGKQIDSAGHDHDGDALIEKALAKFNTATHEPPACVGHPEDNKPAYGWVEGLKKGKDKLGTILLAKFKQVEPTFGQMVKEGRFKKRSSAFYPDGTLRHVAFLGAMPPAVKGLPDVAFAEGEAASFEFSEEYALNSIADLFRNMREWLIEKFGQDVANKIIPDWQIEGLRSAADDEADESQNTSSTAIYSDKEDNPMTFKQKLEAFFSELLKKMPDDGPGSTTTTTQGKQFSEADLERVKREAADAEREKVTAEFNEKAKKTREDGLRGEISAFCDSLVAQGRILPATVKFGLPEILFALGQREETIEFGETKEKATVYDRFKALLSAAKPLVAFSEIATRDKDAGDTGHDQREQAIQKYMETNKADYKTAVLAVSKDQPALFSER